MIPSARLAPFAAALVSGIALAGCSGEHRGSSSPIVNGVPLAEGTGHPANTSLVGIAGGAQELPYCSGTLIAPDLVVTAAHCIDPTFVPYVYFGGPSTPAPLSVLARDFGIHPAHIQSEAQGIWSGPEYDVAWIRLSEPAPAPFAPIRILPRDTTIAEGSVLQVAGYGYSALGDSRIDGIARSAEVVFRGAGREAHRRGTLRVEERGQGTCNGDSGGPLYAKVGDEWFVAGATSMGTHPHGICGEWGAWFTDLSEYSEWIESDSSGREPPPFLVERPDWGASPLPEAPLRELCRMTDLDPLAWGLVHSILNGIGAIDCDDAPSAARRIGEILGDEALEVWVPMNARITEALPPNALERVLADLSDLKAIAIDAPSSFRFAYAPLLARFPGLKSLSLSGTPAPPTDGDWAALRRHAALENLEMSYARELALSQVATLAGLKSLSLTWSGIEDLAELARLGAARNLESIDLSGNEISDLAPLARIPSLRRIRITSNSPPLEGSACPVPGATCEF